MTPSLPVTTVLAATVAVEIGAVAAGSTGATAHPGSLFFGGLALYAVVAGAILFAFRRPGDSHRTLGGLTGPVATQHVLLLGAAIWAAAAEQWWLMALAAALGGLTFAVGSARKPG